MTTYQHFIGIDIGKSEFFVAVHGRKDVQSYPNDPSGIQSFLKDSFCLLRDGLCVLETTGGHEMGIVMAMCDKKFAVHRTHNRKVKHFIASFGNQAKTDPLDAKALAHYGAERHASLERFTLPSSQSVMLYDLMQRRGDLTHALIAEKNRLQSPNKSKYVRESCQALIEVISAQIKRITAEIERLIQEDSVLKEKMKILKTVPGIGNIIAAQLIVLMPELGTLNRKEIASLAGVAPRANDSGQYHGYRRTAPGRNAIKPLLFLAAMAARNSHSSLKTFYENLIQRGKKKMVALVALMRKIIVIANARLKTLSPQTT